MKRTNISTGTPWEAKVGYSRAVRMGQFVHVAGTTSTDEHGNIIGEGDPYAQTAHILKRILGALSQAGATAADVVRTRMYVIDIDHQEQVGKAHAEVFGNIRPAATMVEVTGLAAPGMLVEIEVDAIISE